MTPALRVRPAQPSDLPSLEQHLHLWGPPDYHTQRLAEQQSGTRLWLIAWQGALPVGHLQIAWDGPLQSAVRRYITHCPQLEAIGVQVDRRSHGIGRALIGAAETQINERGYRQAGLSVSLSNERAKQLYERLGYRDWGHGTYTITWDAYDQEGTIQRIEETCVYLLKTW